MFHIFVKNILFEIHLHVFKCLGYLHYMFSTFILQKIFKYNIYQCSMFAGLLIELASELWSQDMT